MVLTIISLVLLAAYIAYAVKVCGIPWSISDTYYQLEKHGRNKWLFQIAMILPSFLLLPAWLECSSENIQFLAFLSCGGLIFVGAAPCFKLELDGKVHYTGTVVSGLSAILWIIFSGMWYIPLITFAVAVYLIIKYKNWMFWVECAAFLSTYIAVLLYT